ncbi:MAG: class I SAM-dependent methyltransferase [Bryobacteraceae bacterium]
MHFSMRTAALLSLSLATAFGQTQHHDIHDAQSVQHSDHMEHHFDPKESAKSFDDPARDQWQMPDRVIAALGLKKGQSIADLGAGTGYFSVRLARSAAAPKVFSADIERAMVTYLRERAAKENLKNMTAVQASAESPNLPEPVDIVLIVDTYHHIGNREAYFLNVAQSLKPGGRVAIIDFKPDYPDGPPKEFRFPKEKFQSEMAKAGYKLAAEHNFLPRQQFLIFEKAK